MARLRRPRSDPGRTIRRYELLPLLLDGLIDLSVDAENLCHCGDVIERHNEGGAMTAVRYCKGGLWVQR